ncbi:hypothetical protein CAPTEDRAFT_189822 [Capitella teleta]|uniref:Uncharacterized protein n=1 Tax=Capitella teleta TaxID=283909 RepID=R7U705_CAPTE|nr:hypothetical protein CAPTEDRAFT_189822 [Capitella teleta]|eukprot:ELU01764.1 hypothetical protein CAPTEDRAFT_189822 [Capitella teleta]
MDLPSISDINSMKRDDLRGVLIDIIKKRNNADTPVFRARFVEHRKTDENADDTKSVHVRASRNESEREKYRKNKEIVRKLNNDAKQADLSNISFSLRDNLAIWKFEKDDEEDHHENHQRPGTPPNELNCLYLNARSVKSVTNERNKPVELQHILSTFEVHLVAITETWLTEDVLDSKVLPQNMQCHRKDRSETRQSVRGGGLLLGIDNRLPSKRRSDLECECEILVCEISGLSRVNIAIILVYRPPSSDCATFTSLLDETLCKVSTEYSNICLLGDFNMPNIDWHALDIVSSTADATFIQ